MTTANLILDTRSCAKNGHPLKIRIHNKGYKYFNLKWYAFKDQWDGHNITKDHPDYRSLHAKILKRQSLLIEQIEYCNNYKLDLEDSYKVISEGLNRELEIMILKKRLAELQRTSSIGILEFLDLRLSEGAGDNMRIFRPILEKYLAGLDAGINEINYEWLNRFIIFQQREGKQVSSINSYLDRLKTLYKEAQRRESLGIKPGNPFENIKLMGAGKRIRTLPNRELIKSLSLENPEHALFMFQLAIGGHDLVDVSRLTDKNLTGGRVKFKRYKNRSKGGGPVIDNKILPVAEQIIEKYKGERLFDFVPDPVAFPKDYARYRSKAFARLRAFDSTLSTKTPRYLFRTTAGNQMIDTLIIMKLQGHSPKGVTFNYQGAVNYSVLDESLSKVVNSLIS